MNVLPMTLFVSNFTPSDSRFFTSRSIVVRGRRKDGMPYFRTPPMTCSASKIVTSAPAFARSPAHARPAGPEPTIATFPSFPAFAGFSMTTAGALSPTKRSRRPIATDSILPFTRMHCASHWLSCGQTRPQIDGEEVALLDRREGAREVAHEDVADEARDVDVDGAALDAGGAHALDAALGLLQRVDHPVAEVHLEEVPGALDVVPLGHLRRVRRKLLELLVVALLELEELLLVGADLVEVLRWRVVFLRLEAALAERELLEVDLVAVEVGALDAGELHLAVDRDAARAAHARCRRP